MRCVKENPHVAVFQYPLYTAFHFGFISDQMVTVTADAAKFISELLEKNNKVGYGVKIYLAGMACSGPQFGMSFQEKKEEGDIAFQTNGLSLFYDTETAKELDECVIEFIDDPNYGTGLTINNPNIKGCSSCGGSCH